MHDQAFTTPAMHSAYTHIGLGTSTEAHWGRVKDHEWSIWSRGATPGRQGALDALWIALRHMIVEDAWHEAVNTRNIIPLAQNLNHMPDDAIYIIRAIQALTVN